MFPVARVVKLRLSDPKEHSKIPDLISSNYCLIVGREDQPV